MKQLQLMAVVCVAAAVACGGKGDESKAKSDQHKTAPAPGAATKPAPRKYRQHLRPPTVLTIDEAQKALPVPANVRTLGEPQRLSSNRVVRTTYCVDTAKDVKAAVGVFTDTLKAKGWRNVRTARARSDKRLGASAEKQRLRVAIMAQRMELPNCVASKGQIRVSVSVYKLAGSSNQMIRDALRKQRSKMKKPATPASK